MTPDSATDSSGPRPVLTSALFHLPRPPPTVGNVAAAPCRCQLEGGLVGSFRGHLYNTHLAPLFSLCSPPSIFLHSTHSQQTPLIFTDQSQLLSGPEQNCSWGEVCLLLFPLLLEQCLKVLRDYMKITVPFLPRVNSSASVYSTPSPLRCPFNLGFTGKPFCTPTFCLSLNSSLLCASTSSFSPWL